MPRRHNCPGVIRQEEERNTLDDADQSELNIDDGRIELAPALAWWIHDATGNRSLIKMSS